MDVGPIGRQRQPFILRAPDKHPSWRLHLASTGFANPAFLLLAVVLASALRGVQSPGGEETEISLCSDMGLV